MSTKKSSKLDLLVRVRYSNPLPPPPCPPKLLNIPTNPMRYAQPEFMNVIVDQMPLPMIVDAECGMPLDLGKWECLWEEDADDLSLNPDPNNLPELDPRDVFLLADPSSSTTTFPSNGGSQGPSASQNTPLAPVSWLRKPEYGRDGVIRSTVAEDKNSPENNIDISRPAQLNSIEQSFVLANDNFSLESLHHPTKPHLTAVESYPLLPDAELWANQYDLFRFSERPGERPPEVDDPRLDCAIIRPMKTEYDAFLAFYLTLDDESAVKFKDGRTNAAPYEVPPNESETVFRFVRDYETTKVEQEVPNEFLLILHDGEGQDDDVFDDGKTVRHEKGAYYKNIERKMYLKKKRANRFDNYEDKWESIRLRHAPITEEEEEERREGVAEVADPQYLMNRQDQDADGELEVDETAGEQLSHVDIQI